MKTYKNKLLVVVGPTTSHKTALSVKLAQLFNGEIINADAFQVYQDMSIGTNAPTQEELNGAKFHFNQFLKMDETWDIKKFQELANKKIKELHQQNKLPILVGGSNLYVEAIIKNYDLSGLGRTNEYEHLTNEELLNIVKSFNQELATKLVNNRKRLTRTVQILKETNDPLALQKQKESPYDYLMIECNYITRTDLYNSINTKVDQMIKDGWVDEVKKLMQLYPNLDWLNNNAFKAIGYRDIYLALVNKTEVNWDKVKQQIRRYAKRQITWIKNKYQDDRIRFLQTNEKEMIESVKQWINK